MSRQYRRLSRQLLALTELFVSSELTTVWDGRPRAGPHTMALMPCPILAHPITKEITMERKFRITVEGRQYNVSVEELTELSSLPYAEPAVYLPPSHLTASAVPVGLTNSHARSAPVIHGVAEAGDVVSTLSGVVELVLVTVGQDVSEGERVLVVEAMKMKTPLTARRAGKVAAILVKVGDGVVPGQALVKLG